VIGPDNRATLSAGPPKDIGYPPANQPVSISTSPQQRREIRLTPQEAEARRRAPMLVILLAWD
jgi:hypothetical protein